MRILVFKDYLTKYNLKNDTMNESELKRVYNCPIYTRGSKSIQTEGLRKLMMVEWEELNGLVL